jgi:hypothetical protein
MLLKAKIKIKGTKALLWHSFSLDSIPLERKAKTGVAGNDPEEWKRTVTYDKETRRLYLDPMCVFGCLREAARHTKSGKGSLQPKLIASLQILDDRVLVDRYLPQEEELTGDQTAPVFLHVCSVKNPSTKARNIRYRVGVSKGWEAEFEIIWEDTLVNEKQIAAILHDAGTLSGIGNGRNIGFGRFTILECKTEKFDA